LLKPIVLSIFVIAMSINAMAQWQKQNINTTASLRGLSVVNERIVWASGTRGTVIKTTDSGKTWNVMTVPGAEKLDFRDIEAFDENTAYILSIGEGGSSRIYKTTDGGAAWKLQFQNTNPKAFFDALACWDKKNCIAMSDPVDGKYLLMKTVDGENWKQMDTGKMPPAKDGEAAFAASGTCLITQGKNNAFIVSGGKAARVFRSTDRGGTWMVSDSPIVSGTQGSGIFGIAMRDARNGVIVGGNYEKPAEINDNLAFTADGGKVWAAGKGPGGFRSGVAYIKAKTIITVGASGSDISYDGGALWKSIDKLSYNAVQAAGAGAVWAVGEKGMIARYVDISLAIAKH
jgi:photosystem II stability/assembly factor-like uncharacterized protein